MSGCGVSRELGVWRMKKHEIEVWCMPDAFGVSRELAHENMVISFLCPCLVCRVSWVSDRSYSLGVGVSRECVWRVRKHEIDVCIESARLVCRVSWVSGA